MAVTAIALAAGAAVAREPVAVMRIEPDAAEAVSAIQAVGVRRTPPGSAELQCETRPDGALERCGVVSERPQGSRLGKAAILLAANYRASAPGPLRVAVSFKSFETVKWTHLPTRDELKQALRVAKLRDNVEGFAAVACKAALDGILADCRVAVSRPNTHYGAAAMTLMAQIRFEPATYDGKPTAARITIPVTFASD